MSRRFAFAFAFLVTLLASSFARVRGDDPAPVAPVAPVPKAPAPPTPKAPAAKAEAGAIHADAWRDAKIVTARFEEALDAVEKECGATFGTRPTVRLSTKEEVKDVLVAELEPLKTVMGLEDSIAATCELMSGMLAAKYDIAHHVVHVVPGNVETLSKLIAEPRLATEETLRVVLAHECTHALDFARFPWGEKRLAFPTQELHKALGACVEGHAQFVAKRISASWGLTAAFDVFTRSITAMPPDMPEFVKLMAKAMNAEAEFAYFQGAAFLEAVFAERGAAGVVAVLESPPSTTRVIEHPEEYLRPDTGPKPFTFDPMFELVRGITPEPAWAHTAANLLEGAVRGQFSDLPEEARRTVLDGFLEARVLMCRRPAEGSMLVFLAMRFRTAAQASNFAKADRTVMELRDAKMKTGEVRIVSATYDEGAGAGGKRPGCVVTKTVEAGPVTMKATTALFAVDSVSFELSFTNLAGLDRATIDPIVDALAAFVGDPAHPTPALPDGFALPAPPPPAPSEGATPNLAKGGPPETSPLVIHFLGPDGRPVPKADVALVVVPEGGPDYFFEGTIDAVFGTIPVVAGRRLLRVFHARDESGHAYDCGPIDVIPAPDTDSIEIRLPHALAIVGRVVDADDQGVADVEVVAVRSSPRIDGHHLFGKLVPGSAKTDANGGFRIGGLGDMDYVLETRAPLGMAALPTERLRGGTAASPIRLVRAAAAVVTVLDAAGKPVADAAVQVSLSRWEDEGTRSWAEIGPAVKSDPEGRASIGGLVPGARYLLVARRADGGLPTFGYWSDSWNGKDVEIRLKNPESVTTGDRPEFDTKITGIVVDASGAPAPHVIVVARDGDHHETDVRSDADGRFVISGPPWESRRGALELAAFATEADRESVRSGKHARWVTATPGTPDVRLQLGGKPVSLTIAGLASGRVVDVGAVGDAPTWRAIKARDGGVVPMIELAGEHVAVLVRSTETDPRCLYEKDVTLAAEGTILNLIDGVATGGTIRNATELKYVEVLVEAPWGPFQVTGVDGGSFQIPSLPPGAYVVRAKARSPTAWVYGRAEFQTGTPIVLELRPK